MNISSVKPSIQSVNDGHTSMSPNTNQTAVVNQLHLLIIDSGYRWLRRIATHH